MVYESNPSGFYSPSHIQPPPEARRSPTRFTDASVFPAPPAPASPTRSPVSASASPPRSSPSIFDRHQRNGFPAPTSGHFPTFGSPAPPSPVRRQGPFPGLRNLTLAPPSPTRQIPEQHAEPSSEQNAEQNPFSSTSAPVFEPVEIDLGHTGPQLSPNRRVLSPPKPALAEMRSESPYARAPIAPAVSPVRDTVIEIPEDPFVDVPTYSSNNNNSEDPFDPETPDDDGYDTPVDEDAEPPVREKIDSAKEVSSGPDLNDVLFDVPEGAVPRRNRSMARKQVKLVHGNLVLDCPVPTKLFSFLPRRDSEEFLYMRYTAVTCDPDHFSDNGFTLRPALYERDIQLAICITMYNEDEFAFTRTMHAVMKNIAYLCSREKSRTWGRDAWKKVQVVIVADGRAKISPGVLDVLAAMGVYQDGIAKSFVNGKPVEGHIFEYTAQVCLNSELTFEGPKDMVPVQILFCLKEKNAKKINSHRWLFNAFGPVLKPNVCVLLDVGTKPNTQAAYRLWKAFDTDSNVAGAAGEIKAIKGRGWRNLINPLVAAQNFEYKMSNILDKPLESVFGYITVLPGALSAYRYSALSNHPDGTGPLHSYFKGELFDGPNQDVFTANMYLAEDRILCWELVAKRDAKWVLKYVREASGETDVPESVPEFISQRRRWLNGALFAAVYSLTHFRQVWRTDHSKIRKTFLHIEFIYQFVQLLFSLFQLGNFFLTFYFLSGSISHTAAGHWLFLIFKYTCICDLAALFIVSMGNRPQGAKHIFFILMAVLTVCTCYATGVGLYYVVSALLAKGNNAVMDNGAFVSIIVALLSTYGLYTVMSFLYMDPWHMFTCAIQYFLMIPCYVCTLQIYAFCNTHDVSWGTKGDNAPTTSLGSAIVKNHLGKDIVELEIPSQQMDIDSAYDAALCGLRETRTAPKKKAIVEQNVNPEDYYRDIRTRVVLGWLVANLLLIMIITEIFPAYSVQNNTYLQFILWSVAALAIFRAIGSVGYLIISGVRFLYTSKYRLSKGFKRLASRDPSEKAETDLSSDSGLVYHPKEMAQHGVEANPFSPAKSVYAESVYEKSIASSVTL